MPGTLNRSFMPMWPSIVAISAGAACLSLAASCSPNERGGAAVGDGAATASASSSSSSSSATSLSGSPDAHDQRLSDLRGEIRAMVASARDRVFPALVNIEVVTLEYQGGKESKNRATGSGTIISPDGYVLTNAHVTDEGHRFFCTLADKQRIPATLVGEDPWTDLAVLKLDTSKLALSGAARFEHTGGG
jgi:S1-C subfamily serine protease